MGKTGKDKQGMQGAWGVGPRGEPGACVGELAREGNRVAEGRVQCEQLEAAGREHSAQHWSAVIRGEKGWSRSQEEGFKDLSTDAFTHLFNQTLLGSFPAPGSQKSEMNEKSLGDADV